MRKLENEGIRELEKRVQAIRKAPAEGVGQVRGGAGEFGRKRKKSEGGYEDF